ncbi:MAG: Ig-like domain-containing protein [Clostridia bacterium]|nr:Ig-like domain-containing protein [Clostridia bacterium]
MKIRTKITSLVMALIMIVSVFSFAGCLTAETPVNPPAAVYKVQSVTLKHNDKSIEGTLSVDKSIEEIQLSADVVKDAQADGTVTYSSSNKKVATINSLGKVKLLSEGETVITAQAGDKVHTIVLIVGNAYGTKKTYTITVNGGVANVTEAAKGDYVTLSAIIPEHKDFVEWRFNVNGLWVNGNTFKMPPANVEVTAKYVSKLYQLNVVGATVEIDGEKAEGEVIGNTEDGTDVEHNIVSYPVRYDTPIKVTALEAPAGEIFVGWDEGVRNNRVGEMGIGEYEFNMPGETYTVWANYSKLTPTILKVNPSRYWDASKGSKVITTGVPEGESEDPDLEGLSGYRLTFTAGESAITDTPENIQGSYLDTITSGTNTMKAIFKNRGSYDVTLELYATYYGNICTSGYVKVPAGKTVTKYFTGGLGISAPWMGVALRETIASGSGTFNVDMVLGAAPMYPEGDPLLSVSGKAEIVKLEASYDVKINGWARERLYNEKLGLMTYAIYGAQFTNVSESNPAARVTKISNMPAYDENNPYTIIYARVINNATSGDFLSKIDICVGTDADPTKGTNTYYATAVHEQIGDVVVVAIKVPRTANDGQFYFSVRKTTVEGTGTYYPHNFSVLLTYNNVLGYEGEVA